MEMFRCRKDEADAASLYSGRKRKQPLRIRAFYIRLAVAASGWRPRAVPESLTLVYLPRINGAALEVNGARVRPDAPAFVVLHRVRSAESGLELVYGSTDRVRAGAGVRFEAYVGEERAVKGSFRWWEGGGWRMQCGCCAAEKAAVDAVAAEVWVAGEDQLVMRERVELAAARRRHGRFCSRLEEIPEELGEGDCWGEEDDDAWEVLGCADGFQSSSEEDDDCGEKSWKEEVEAEDVRLKEVNWAVDLGIWAVCLGVGLLVLKASY